MPITTDWSRMLKMLFCVRKYGDMNDSATAMTSASPSMRTSSRRVSLLKMEARGSGAAASAAARL
jgi:hypothetical protein